MTSFHDCARWKHGLISEYEAEQSREQGWPALTKADARLGYTVLQEL